MMILTVPHLLSFDGDGDGDDDDSVGQSIRENLSPPHFNLGKAWAGVCCQETVKSLFSNWQC